MPAEFAEVLEADDGVMLVGKGDKFQLWNPKRWQAAAMPTAPRWRPSCAASREVTHERVHVPVLAERSGRCAAAARRRPLCRRHVRRRRLHAPRSSIARDAR
jgi:hypothetical protein